MKLKTTLLILTASATSVALSIARGPGGPGGGPGGPGGGEDEGRPPQPPPIIAALDADHDGIISADEIAKASEALKSLDANGDGKLTQEELHPERGGDDRGDGRSPRPGSRR